MCLILEPPAHCHAYLAQGSVPSNMTAANEHFYINHLKSLFNIATTVRCCLKLVSTEECAVLKEQGQGGL